MSTLPRTHYTPDELAEMSGLSGSFIYKAISDGRLPAQRPRGTTRLLVRVSDWEAFLEDRDGVVLELRREA